MEGNSRWPSLTVCKGQTHMLTQGSISYLVTNTLAKVRWISITSCVKVGVRRARGELGVIARHAEVREDSIPRCHAHHYSTAAHHACYRGMVLVEHCLCTPPNSPQCTVSSPLDLGGGLTTFGYLI
jgi:hypothetical protein